MPDINFDYEIQRATAVLSNLAIVENTDVNCVVSVATDGLSGSLWVYPSPNATPLAASVIRTSGTEVSVNGAGTYQLDSDVGVVAGATRYYNVVHFNFDTPSNVMVVEVAAPATVIPDTEPPVINLNGDAAVTLYVDEAFTDLGAVVSDNIDANRTIYATSGAVDTSTAGTYYLYYDAQDAAGNVASQAARQVTVRELTQTLSFDYEVEYMGFDVVAFDDVQRGEVSDITIQYARVVPTVGNFEVVGCTTNSVTDNGNGTYTIEISAPADLAVLNGNSIFDVRLDTYTHQSNANVLTRTGWTSVNAVNPSTGTGSVVDQFTGDAPQSGGQFEYTVIGLDAAYTYTLNENGTAEITRVDAGNTDPIQLTEDFAVQVRFISPNGSIGRTANLTYQMDYIAPVLTLVVPATVTVGYGENYVELGATATDNKDLNINSKIVISDTVNDNVSGIYTVAYDVQDDAGNDAAQITRTVQVLPQSLVVIDSVDEAKDGATINFSYAGADITGFEYRVDGGAWGSASSPLNLTGLETETSYSVDVRPFNNALVGEVTSTTVTTLAGVDATPDAFTLDDVTGQDRATYAVSNAVTVSGVDVGVDIPVQVSNGEYCVSTDGGSTWAAWTTTQTDVRLNYQLRVRHSTNSNYNAQTITTLDVGGVSDTFASTTLADLVAPVISLVGGNVSIEQFSAWTDPGYSATDNNDGSVSVSVSGSIDTDTVGPQQLTYTATDSAGNVASVFRIVTITEAQAVGPTVLPTINTNGQTAVTLLVGDDFTLPAWTAQDDQSAVQVQWDRTVLDTSTPIVGARFTATATNSIGSVTAELLVDVVAQSSSDGFVDAAEVVRVLSAPTSMHLHDGKGIPTTEPMDTDGHIWKQFNLDLLVAGEVLIGTPTVLINEQVVMIGDAIDGMAFNEIQTDGAKRIKVRLQGAQDGQLYTLTVRYTTNYTPSNDRSQQFYGARL